MTNALPAGHLLNHGRYRILRVLGEGGYGITYEALDLQRRRSVAIKEFFPNYLLRRLPGSGVPVCAAPGREAALAHARMRFHEEAVLLTSLKHVKEIVEVYHSFEENQTAYYTMELLRGTDMQRRLQSHGRMSWQELAPIVIQILRALYATHQMGYIHRDVTPDNIFLRENGTVQLIDFGNARRFRDNPQLTAVVKDKFAPREQYSRLGRQGPWTDVYSLCVTIYYAMTGLLPRKATEQESGGLPPLHTQVSVPKEVSHAVQVGMSAEEDKRYQSIADLAYALFPGQAVLGEVSRQFAAVRKVQGGGGFPARQGVTRPVQRTGEAPQRPVVRRRSGQEAGSVLHCTHGRMKGLQVRLQPGRIQSIGRGSGNQIQYPGDATSVSRWQCSLVLDKNGTVYIQDEHSTFGTAVNGTALTPGMWTVLKSGDYFVFGKELFVLR